MHLAGEGEVDRAVEETGELLLQVQKIRQAEAGRGIDLNQQIDVAFGPTLPRAIEPNRLRRVMPRARSRGVCSRRIRSARSHSASPTSRAWTLLAMDPHAASGPAQTAERARAAPTNRRGSGGACPRDDGRSWRGSRRKRAPSKGRKVESDRQ